MEQRYNFLKANQHPAVAKEVIFIFFKLFTHFDFNPYPEVRVILENIVFNDYLQAPYTDSINSVLQGGNKR